MRNKSSSVFVAAMSVLAVAAAIEAPSSVAQMPASQPRVLLDAAEALGGLAQINAIDNITLIGYGQRLYQYGGGGITGSVHAPLKWQQLNDLRRVYDLENGRFQALERHNFLFTFLGSGMHSWNQTNRVLDGEIAYDVTGSGRDARYDRVPEWNTNILYVDGVRNRRMWMMNNPIVALRSAMRPGSTVSNLRDEAGEDAEYQAVDVTLETGDKYSIGFDRQSRLPAWVRWSAPHDNLGQITLTTYFTGFVPFGDVLLPLGYNTELDWRGQDFLKIYVDTYILDGDIGNLAAPASVRNMPVPGTEPPEITAAEAGDGVWRLSTGTIVFEFEDHLKLYELGNPNGVAVIDAARALAPGKPVTDVIISHAHFDHLRGIRDAIAEGLTVIGRRGNEGIIREMATHDAPDFPDLLELNPQPLKYVPVDEHLRLADDRMTVDVYWDRANIHMADGLFAYVPDQNIFVEGDMATAAQEWQFWGDNYLDNIEHYGLDVDTIAPVHMPIMTQREVVEMVRGGVERARAHCASELAKGNYFPGCPVQSKRF
jgi:glyoxylase-like metal-dependent hydrolase (beta-lactamase superfamily II)